MVRRPREVTRSIRSSYVRTAWIALAALTLGACTSVQPVDTTMQVTSTEPSTAVSSTTTTEQPSTTSSVRPTTTSAPTTTTTSQPATTTIPTPTTTVPDFPPAVEVLTHGEFYWAVYLAVADDFDDPALEEATQLAESYGYFAGVADIGCDAGADVALGVEPGASQATVGVLFDSAVAASQFVVALDARGHSIAGMGRIQAFCLD
jgi:hypothetical protein